MSSAKTPEIEDVRVLFHKAESSQKVCVELIELLEPYNDKNNALFLGYRGSANMMMAKHLINPFSKLSYFKKGKLMLEKAIQFDQKNVELRFLRYTIQTNVPSFLNYSDNKENDRVFLLQSLNRMNDQKLKIIISNYLKKAS
ncbi:MAG: hypothetical protein B7X86_00670 [Sphingobacteriales bacterium 17-39-43]|uniref:hypothetical protein n=1 Tax=Daejeonella sp. TaxID=2805397 RepID=UPI000BD3B58E|nr:hypothetical protein [Daejeonella sp.]OYZ32888.1 MAG: hypothetical protein B7Y24_00675 [Sphingobacteriales bacterium 16-39-50]OYZ55467.1 MAG: hypothetical protein B7Y19_04585 [Sphingobacteriales bacterium 24-40-4]OZA26298.1 MAG: hypothetical protein B7X86_00670 [Sphingobacteriales bacterium 17-39-43]HQS05312.1 hypothetical protein [Daejeonella sp.]HQS51583.1 hypothetical protein [Daejeonella sp.]